MSASEIATVLAWHDALNSGDVDTLVDLSSDDVDLAGPQGATQGTAALRDWAARAGLGLVPGRMFYHDGVLVVEEEATWRADPQTPQPLAIAFRVVHDQVTSVFRHASLAEALAATGLEEKDLVED